MPTGAFFRKGVTRTYAAPAVVGVSPTRAEINAATNLSTQLNSISGFQLSNQRINTAVEAEAFTSQIDGPDTVADSEMVFIDDSTSSTIRNLLAKGTALCIIRCPYGDVATKRCEVWRVKTTGVNDDPSLGDSDPARFNVGLAVTIQPTLNAVIPA